VPIQRYLIFLLLVAIVGVGILEAVIAKTSENHELELAKLNSAALALAEHRALGFQLDNLITTSDLLIASDVVYLRESFRQQYATLDQTLTRFQENFDSQSRYFDLSSLRAKLNELSDIVDSQMKAGGVLSAYDSKVNEVIEAFEESVSNAEQHLASANANIKASNKNRQITIILALIAYVASLAIAFLWVVRHVAGPIKKLSVIETAEQAKTVMGTQRRLPIEVQRLADHLISLLTDLEHKVTERTQALEQRSLALEAQADELRKARDDAEAADKAKGNFLSSMSHELRSPLNHIIGVSDILLEEKLDAAQARLVKLSRSSSVYLLRLIEATLNFASLEQGKVKAIAETVELSSVLSDCEQLALASYPDKEIAINIVIDKDVPSRVLSDSAIIKQIIVNLLNNSLKYSENGSIEVTCALTERANDSLLVIAVKDQGPGIPHDALQKIFEPFQQLKPAKTTEFSGIGLGLSICKQLVEVLGGSLSAESKMGIGTEMRLEIPVIPVSVAQSSAPRLETDSLRGLKILIAEDEPVNAEILKLTLKQMGSEPDHVTDGEQALHTVKEKDYDFVLMDIQMPVLDGLAATRKIRETTGINQPKIIFVTAFVDELHKKQAAESGGDGFLAKPIERQVLRSLLSG